MALPVFSVDTHAEAEDLQQLFGSKVAHGALAGRYVVQEIHRCASDKEALGKMAQLREKMARAYKRLKGDADGD